MSYDRMYKQRLLLYM